MADRVRPMKMETSVRGTETDEFLTALDPKEDHVEARGLFVQNDTSDDEVVLITRDASSPDNMTFKDGVQTTPLTLTQLASGALPPATEVGQFLFSYNGSTFEIVKPLVSDCGFTITDDDGHMVVVE